MRSAAGAVVVACLVLAGCSATPMSTPASQAAPPSCASAPCATAGAIRWSIPLGLRMKMRAAAPVSYLTPANSIDFSLASAGGTIVVGWDGTVRGLDAGTGAAKWTAPAGIVPAGSAVLGVHPVGQLVAISTVPTGNGVGRDVVLDPATGRKLASFPAVSAEGAVWSDGKSIVAIEPTELVKQSVAASSAEWTVPLPASVFPRKAVAGLATPVRGAVVGGDVILGDGVHTRAFSWATGAPVTLPEGLIGWPTEQSGNTVVMESTPGTRLFDAAAGRILESSPDTDRVTVDTAKAVLYVIADVGLSSRLRAYSTKTGASLPSPPTTIGYYDPTAVDQYSVVAVRSGVAVLQSNSSNAPGSATTFQGRNVTTGALLWTSAALSNYYAIPGNGDLAGGQAYDTDYLAGLTCAGPLAGPTVQTCGDVRLTVVND